jgi:hypothetical protein
MKRVLSALVALATVTAAVPATAHDWRHNGYRERTIVIERYQSRPSYRQYRSNNSVDALGGAIVGLALGAIIGGIAANAKRQQAVQDSDVITTSEGKVFAKCYGNLPSIPKIHRCLGDWQELRYANQ